MSQELLPVSEFGRHLDLLRRRLSSIPELEPAFALIEADPVHANNVYAGYLSLTDRMAKLDEGELIKIDRSQEFLQGEVGSASKVGANDIVRALGDRKGVLSTIAAQSLNSESPYYLPAVDMLATRMEGGHRLKLSGKSPSDHDPESLKVIWGHTVISGQEALLHFMLMHYLERYMAEALSSEKFELANQKDFFINAMTDVVILNGIADLDDPIFKFWVTPKEQGGLGWITKDRLDSYLVA